VGPLHHGNVLLQVGSEQEPAVVSDQATNPAEEGDCFVRLEVPDRRPGKEGDGAAGSARVRQGVLGGVVGADRLHRQLGKGFGDLDGELHQLRARDVDGNVCGGFVEVLQQQPRLVATSAAELDEPDSWPDPPRDVRSVLPQDSDLRTRRIVRFQPRDPLEESRPALVVEVLGGERARLYAEPARDVLAESIGGRLEVVERYGPRAGPRLDDPQTSLASRTPVNCQVASGGKKLRYVRRMWVAEVAHDPPRSTNWLHMNLPLYSPSAPGGGW